MPATGATPPKEGELSEAEMRAKMLRRYTSGLRRPACIGLRLSPGDLEGGLWRPATKADNFII